MAEKKKVAIDPLVVLNDVYSVSIDSKCLILRKKFSNLDNEQELTKEEKKDGNRVMGYFCSWEHLGSTLIEDIAREKLKQSKEQKATMEEFIKIMKDSNKEVSDIFKNIDEIKKIKK